MDAGAGGGGGGGGLGGFGGGGLKKKERNKLDKSTGGSRDSIIAGFAQ